MSSRIPGLVAGVEAGFQGAATEAQGSAAAPKQHRQHQVHLGTFARKAWFAITALAVPNRSSRPISDSKVVSWSRVMNWPTTAGKATRRAWGSTT